MMRTVARLIGAAVLVVGWAETGSGRRHAVVFSTSPQPCVGDCTGQGVVTVDAILTLVNIVLGSTDPSTCPSGIPAGTTVDVGLIVQAVTNALSGCSGS